MQSLLIVCVSFIFLIFLNYLFKKKKILIDKNFLKHKSFTSNEAVPLTGGVLILFNILFFYTNNYILIFIILIFILGVLSDLLLIVSPIKKFIIQLVIVILFLKTLNLNIISTKIVFIDYFLENKFFALIFTSFCILILINGSNFMDGVNTLVCGYYIIVISLVIYIGSNNKLFYDFYNLYYLLLSLLAIFLLNAFSKTYLGDSGTFLLSFILSYNLINFCNYNLLLPRAVSPIFIVLLLWYPAFENFFSILRKINNKINPSMPDNSHLHHLLLSFIRKKINTKNNFKNTLTGIIINFYNLIIFLLASEFYYHTQYLSYFVIFNIIIYLLVYYFLNKKQRIFIS
jgi:UDP-N-acetylmuramyl pentapeptide phosphotransferase/UDP-N-acetylglucosamine-1-phosphate transferase